MREKTKTLLVAALALVLLVIAVIMVIRLVRNDPVVTDETIEMNLERSEHMGEEPEATPPPEPVHILPSEEAILLAKIMAAEDGVGWSDAMIMCIGEVVLNRVASPEYPNTVREVLYQVDGGFIQYAPVHDRSFEEAVADERYIALAERLLDGERVLNNPQIVFQALFEQGRGTVLTYHDIYLGSTTYFCLTDKPGLYG